MNKSERKFIKLNKKAQNCLSREIARKIIRKSDKVRQKMTEMSEA